jgi:spore protease
MVVGLGNRSVTPDALGPKVISRILVTRHIKQELPEALGSEGEVRSVCAITPGVMGITGIETAEIIKGVADKVKPDIIIAIDALAARRTSRINAAIQVSDTGINPGSGMGNKRAALNEQTLGCPVIAIGVPTVIDAATLVNDAMDRILDTMIAAAPEGGSFYETLKSLEREEKYYVIAEALNPYAGNMFVTPKEVDSVIDRLANIISNAINIALHPGIGQEDINKYIL